MYDYVIFKTKKPRTDGVSVSDGKAELELHAVINEIS
jgi:hypothetical protein